MSEDVTTVKAQKVRKKRLSYKEEISMLRKLPRTQRLIVASKFIGVILVAIGLEGVITQNWALAIAGFSAGIVTSVLPIKVQTGMCLACNQPLGRGQSICPHCGAPQM